MQGQSVKDARILVLGAAYKPDVGDVRESPADQDHAGCSTSAERRSSSTTPSSPPVPLNGATLHRTELTNHSVARADLVAVLTPHSAYDLDWVSEHAKLVFDARNAFGPNHRSNVVRL